MTNQPEPDPGDRAAAEPPAPEPPTSPSGGPATSPEAGEPFTPADTHRPEAGPRGPDADPTTSGGDTAPRPGVREQFGRTRRAAADLVRAHVDLLKVEIGEIVAQLKTLSVLAGLVLGLGLVLGNLLFIGTALFLGEWLFGSIGWGVLHGALLLVGVLTALVLVILGAPGGRLAASLGVAAIAGVVVAAVLGLNVVRRGAEVVAAPLAPSLAIDPAALPALVAVIVGAILVGLIGLVAGARAGGIRVGVVGLIAGAVVGALVGLILGVGQSWHVAIAIGVAVSLLLWPILQVVMTRSAIAPRERFGRLWPRETYDTALETKAWLGEQWANRRKTLARR